MENLQHINIPHESLKTRLRVRYRSEKCQCWLCGRIETIATLPEDIVGMFDDKGNLVHVVCRDHLGPRSDAL